MKLAHSNICKTTNQSWAASQQSRKQRSETEPSSSTWTSADSAPRMQNLELCSQVERQSKTHTLHGCGIGKDFKHTPQVSSTAETENTNQSIICWNCWAHRPKQRRLQDVSSEPTWRSRCVQQNVHRKRLYSRWLQIKTIIIIIMRKKHIWHT